MDTNLLPRTGSFGLHRLGRLMYQGDIRTIVAVRFKIVTGQMLADVQFEGMDKIVTFKITD